MLESIKVKAIEAAVRTLTNLGCKIKVITPDGVEFGELVVVTAKMKSGVGAHVNSFVSSGYRKKVEALSVGEIATVSWPDNKSIENLRSSMLTCGTKAFGKGTCTSEIDRAGGSVSILRVA